MIRRLSALLLFVALAAGAQPGTASGQLRVQVAGGLANTFGDFGDVASSGYQGRVGAQLSFPLFPVSLRAEGEASRFPAAERSDGNATLLGANVSAILGLGGVGISPYLLGGVGTYRLSFSQEFEGRGATTDVGYHGGVGVDLGLFGLGGFVEARFVHVSREGEDVSTLPIVVGVRF